MKTKLEGIAKVAKERPKEPFTSLAHLINVDMIKMCHLEMGKEKASGVDKVTKEEYSKELETNLEGLVKRMKNHSYKPLPVRRVYIEKPGTSTKRPLGIPAYEDKLVQSALGKILNAIYEQEFLPCSFGFRPNRSCHDALSAIDKIIERRPVKYVVDVDIKGFFNNVDHEWMLKFVGHRIKDPNILRLISKMLKSGVVEAGIEHDTPVGTPQGGPVSPILANIYLHYVIDLWFEVKIRKQCKGAAFMVRYADDNIFCFENMEEAEEFYKLLRERLGKFKLEIAEEKSKIVELRKHRNGDENHQKPGTFDFLGFTHFIGKGRKSGERLKRKTSRKKYKNSLLRVKEWIKRNIHMAVNLLIKKLNQKLTGYYVYYGVSDNFPMLSKFDDEVRKLLFKYLNRRSQRRSYNEDKFKLLMEKYPLKQPKIYKNIFALKPGISYTV